MTLDTEGGNFLWRAYLTSEGTQKVELDQINITFDDVTAPTSPTVDPATPGATTITGTGENGTTITLNLGTCTNAIVTVAAGVWSCDLAVVDAPTAGTTITATSTDTAGNFSTGSYTIPNPSSSGSSGGSVKFICKDETASNYNSSNFGRHRQSRCEYDEGTGTTVTTTTPTESNPFGGELCPSHLIITNNMKDGDTNGVYSSYNQGVITEISILQAHINRLLEGEYGTQAAGPVDIWYRSKTKRGVERLQIKLNQLLYGKITPLAIDGIVGPFTKGAINMSC
jgi:hypothetical protein